MSATMEMDRLVREGGSPLIEHLGEIPCSTDGCSGAGSRVRILDRVLTMPCDACISDANQREDERDHEEAVARLLARAGGSARMREFTFESYFTDPAAVEALKVVTRWRDSIIADRRSASNLFLCGPVGCGKTGLLWPVVESLCEAMVPARFVDFPTLLEQMRQSFSKKVPFDTLTDLGRVQVLVVDDIGAEKPTEWTLGALLHLVNTRYERCLPTAYVSNYDPDELIEEKLNRGDVVIPERIVSRMIEGAVQHRIKADSRRRPKSP